MIPAYPSTWGTVSAWPQSTLTARARELAAGGLDQAAIMAELAREYPCQPSENHYANPAAIAVMERITKNQKEAKRREQHDAWRASRGMPPAPAEDEVPAEPDAGELAGVTNGRELLKLCRQYGIAVGVDESDGSIRVSRTIDSAGPLAAGIRRHRSSLVKQLSGQGVIL